MDNNLLTPTARELLDILTYATGDTPESVIETSLALTLRTFTQLSSGEDVYIASSMGKEKGLN